MRLAIDEFIRSFLTHVLPGGFHRTCQYGLFANGGRANNIAQARQLLSVPEMRKQSSSELASTLVVEFWGSIRSVGLRCG